MLKALLRRISGTEKPEQQELLDAAYLVSRGVRPLALAAYGLLEDLPGGGLKWLQERVQECTYEGVHNAILVTEDTYQVVFAAESWAIDIFRWANSAPGAYGDMIHGLLLGYSADAIAAFLERIGEYSRLPITEPDGVPILEFRKGR